MEEKRAPSWNSIPMFRRSSSSSSSFSFGTLIPSTMTSPLSAFMRTSCGYREIGGVAPEEVGQDRVDHGREKQADRHRLGHRAADADRAAGHGVAVIDADADDQEGEHHRLDQRVAEVGQV